MTTKKTTGADVIEKMKENHIWLNAFNCVAPTDEFLRDVGRSVINMLSNKEHLLPNYLDDYPPTGSVVEDIAAMTPVLYLSINKS